MTRYLQTNERLREVVSTMLELAYLPPHRSLHLGKVHLCISVDCDHTRVSALLGSATEYLRSKVQVCVRDLLTAVIAAAALVVLWRHSEWHQTIGRTSEPAQHVAQPCS